MQELSFTDNNGNNFVVNLENNNYEAYKIVNDVKVKPTPEELKFIIENLQKIKDLNKQEKPKTYDEYLNLLKELIKNGTIKNTDQLRNFISSTTLSDEEKGKLAEEGISELSIEDIVDLKNRIIDSLKNQKTTDLKAYINFNVKDNSFGSKYCEVRLNYQDSIGSFEHINENLNYTDTLKRELIEPVTLEVAMRSRVKDNFMVKVANDLNNRCNYFLKTEEKTSLSLNNVEYDYAEKLQKKCEEIKEKMPVQDAAEREDKVSEETQDINNEEREIPNDAVTDEYGNVYDRNGEYLGQINEYGEIDKSIKRENTLKLVRVKNENGFTMATIIIAITSFITSLLFLIQMLILG